MSKEITKKLLAESIRIRKEEGKYVGFSITRDEYYDLISDMQHYDQIMSVDMGKAIEALELLCDEILHVHDIKAFTEYKKHLENILHQSQAAATELEELKEKGIIADKVIEYVHLISSENITFIENYHKSVKIWNKIEELCKGSE